MIVAGDTIDRFPALVHYRLVKCRPVRAAVSQLDQAAQMATARTSQVMLVGTISTAKAWTRSKALNG